jgi:hypothetical protein
VGKRGDDLASLDLDALPASVLVIGREQQVQEYPERVRVVVPLPLLDLAVELDVSAVGTYLSLLVE